MTMITMAAHPSDGAQKTIPTSSHMTDPGELKPSTRAIWGAEREPFWERSAQVPVALSVSFQYETVDEMMDVVEGRAEGHIYSRNTNPTVAVLERKMIELERGAEACTAFATGMGAISNALMTLLRPGDRCVSIADTYGGTAKLFMDFLPRYGVECVLCRTTDEDEILREIEAGCTVLYLESPTNPTLKIVDIAKLAAAGRDAGATVVVDNTFASPLNQSPLLLGAHLVVHSCTKYLNGHSDCTGGVLLGEADLIDRVFHYREIHGSTLDPMSAYLIIRGLKTLDMRIKQHNASAMRIARFLASSRFVSDVFYPGLETHLRHDVARRQMSGFGGMLAFTVASLSTAKRFCESLELAYNAASLGHVETLVSLPMTSSHVECSQEERRQLGIDEGLIRYSTGIEDTDDLIADIAQALERSH
jgi:cystathionine gamma-synthase